jgi:hypothetical protein
VRDLPTRKTRLGEEGPDRYLASLTPSERMQMVWTLTLQSWMFKTGSTDEPRLRRDIGRVVRGRRRSAG